MIFRERPPIKWDEREADMMRTTVFWSNRSQAIRLPKAVAFPDGVNEVFVLRNGKRRVIVPTNAVWDDFFDARGVEFGPRQQPQS